jgi:hypothetical protein
MTATELIGRDPEIAAVELLLAGIAGGGGSLLVLGDPGIGKSALAEVASRRAAGRGMRVLACAGVPGEAHLSFAGLHQLLRPALDRRDQLIAVLVADGQGVVDELHHVAATRRADREGRRPGPLPGRDRRQCYEWVRMNGAFSVHLLGTTAGPG